MGRHEPRGGFSPVRFLDEAADDLRSLAEASRPLFLEAMRLLRRLDRGDLAPVPLHDVAKTGDLGGCGKIVPAVEGEPEYRIVVREVGGNVDVVDVIAVEDRLEDLPCLLAGLRLHRIDDPVRRSDAQRRVARIRRSLRA